MPMNEESVRSANWSGSIPIVLSLAPSSLSSPTMPTSIHVMMARQSYLHIGLKNAVKRLHKFAPTVPSISTSIVRKEPKPGQDTEASDTSTPTPMPSRTQTKGADYPIGICWFEDEESKIALRWHLFAGILWDMKRKPKSLPWKLRLHFSQYPTSQILPMDGGAVMTVLERSYKHSLKQALFLQKGSAKVGMSISKQSFEQLWDSILSVNCKLYQQVDDELQGLSNLLPVRLLIDSKPPIQRPLKAEDGISLGGLLASWAPSLFHNTENGTEAVSTETQCFVQGLQIPLSAVLKDLWRSLSHPDHFLYVVVTSK